MPNRFEQVDEPAEDAITVAMLQTASGQWAKIFVPQHLAPNLGEDWTSEKLPPKDALSNAVRFANKLTLPIVILDPNKIWKNEWGELYRQTGDEGGAENP